MSAGEWRAHDFEFAGIRMGYFEPIVVEDITRDAPSFRTQDASRPRADGLWFGRDYVDPPTWTLHLATNPESFSDGVESMRRLQAAWMAEAGRRQPGWHTELRYEIAGQVCVVYGRPRQFTPSHTKTYRLGVLRADAEFQLMDATAYKDAWQELTLRLFPASPGGLIFPAGAPFIFGQGGQSREGMIVNRGVSRSPMRIRITGPVVDPVVRSISHGWQIGLRTSLAYDQEVVIDTREKSVTRNDGAALGGAVTRHSTLGRWIDPGADEVTFEGYDPTGSSRAHVMWQEAVGAF